MPVAVRVVATGRATQERPIADLAASIALIAGAPAGPMALSVEAHRGAGADVQRRQYQARYSRPGAYAGRMHLWACLCVCTGLSRADVCPPSLLTFARLHRCAGAAQSRKDSDGPRSHAAGASIRAAEVCDGKGGAADVVSPRNGWRARARPRQATTGEEQG